jgi:hypothetical protein
MLVITFKLHLSRQWPVHDFTPNNYDMSFEKDSSHLKKNVVLEILFVCQGGMLLDTAII